jgi:SAM-dependent methyltransferase
MPDPSVSGPSDSPPAYDRSGHCPICETAVRFTSTYTWYRDHLFCSSCRSIPRERALALTLARSFPNWRRLRIHESSPVGRGISLKMKRECRRYVGTQFLPDEARGAMVRGFRNENLEAQTFPDRSFDLVVTLDVMEHVNKPDVVIQEVCRTLEPGGAYVFTTPTYKHMTVTERRARYRSDGGVEHFAEPEYHGNPVSPAGSLVTFRYGYDLPELIWQWSGMDVEVLRFHDHSHGIIGEFTEVYVATRVDGCDAPSIRTDRA